jgi:hypothetical protein
MTMGKPAGLIAPADCRFHLLIAMIVELYPQMRVGSPRKDPNGAPATAFTKTPTSDPR